MQRRVFGYRSSPLMPVSAFLLFWAVGWIYGVFHVDSWRTNGRLMTPQEIEVARPVCLAIGILILVGGVRLLGEALVARVIVDGAEVRSIDWKGTDRVRAPRSSVEIVNASETGSTSSGIVVKTPNGNFQVGTAITDFGLLRWILEHPNSTESFRRPVAVEALPQPVTFDYRWTTLHLFSFPWLAFVIFFLSTAVTQADSLEHLLPFVYGGSLFLFVGLWMQLTGWIERINVGPDGIEWIDWLNRSRVRAKLEEIMDLDAPEVNRAGSLQIHTSQGTIRASAYLRGSSELQQSIRGILEVPVTNVHEDDKVTQSGQ